MKKIRTLIYKVLFFSLFLQHLPAECQLNSTKENKLSPDSARYFKLPNYLSDNPNQSELDRLIDSTLESFMLSPQNCGLSIGISIKGKHYFYNYGETKRDSKHLPDSTSIYDIGSISKTFTGLLLAQAVTENRLKLEDDIRKYLPRKYQNLIFYGKPIRVKHLANHSSGLARIPENMTKQSDYDKLDPYKHYTKEMLLNYLGTVKLKDEPGTEFEYSSLGVAVLGIILEEVYRISYETLVTEKICIPYQLINTGLNLTPEQTVLYTMGYDKEGFEAQHWDMGIFAPAGAIKSSTKDMLTYLELNRLEREKPFTLVNLPTYKMRETVGLSWFIKKTKQGNNLIWHNGATFGSGSFCGFIKEKECSVIIMTNSEASVDFLGIAILNYLQK